MINTILFAALLSAGSVPDTPPILMSRGYGWIIDRRAEPSRLYHTAGSKCWADPEAEPDLLLAHSSRRADGAFAFTADLEPQTTTYVFDRIEELPAACSKSDPSDRAAVDAIADLMSNRYPGFEARGVDFATRRAAVLDGLEPDASTEDHFAAATSLLGDLNDPHLELSAELGGEEYSLEVSQGTTLDAVRKRTGERPERTWLEAWRTGIAATILEGEGHTAANNRIYWGMSDGIGYIAILTMGGFDPEDDSASEVLDSALDEALTAFASAKAVIVDVSNNRGGYDVVSQRIASRFTDLPRAAYGKRPAGTDLPYQTVMVQPSDRVRYLGPVWLLTSDITVSAGETFSQMMQVLPQVVHAGTPTRGAFADQIPITLPNGWSFAMPMEIYVDTDGEPLEGRGLIPEEPIDLYPLHDLDWGHSVAVKALMARLSK